MKSTAKPKSKTRKMPSKGEIDKKRKHGALIIYAIFPVSLPLRPHTFYVCKLKS